MMCAVTWFSVMPGRRNFIVSQWAPSPMAPTMRRHSCSSTFLTARASIIGDMPSTHSMPLRLEDLDHVDVDEIDAELHAGYAALLHLRDDGVGELGHLLARCGAGRAL